MSDPIHDLTFDPERPASSHRMAEEIRKLIADEREACAKLAEDWDKRNTETNFGRCIARLIRARSANG